MKRVEEMMGWREEEGRTSGTRKWIDHLGQYRSCADVDDILSWFSSNGFVLGAAHQDIYGKFVVRLFGIERDVIARGFSFINALTNAVHSWVVSR